MILSAAVFASGTVSPAAHTRSSVVSARSPSLKAAYSASGTSCAISAPVKSWQALATAPRSTLAASRLYCASVTASTSHRSRCVGRSTAKISSKRPLRSSSGGNADTSFAVATTKLCPLRSCIQVSSVPSASCDTPPSSPPDEIDFSNSSMNTTHRPTASIVASAERRFASDSPTYLDLVPPMSSLRSGTPHAAATAFAVRLLPPPGGPTIRTPFGAGSPKSLARCENALLRCVSHAFRFSSPPTAARPRGSGSYHSTPRALTTARFSAPIIAGTILFPCVTSDLVNARAHASAERPTAASIAASLVPLGAMTARSSGLYGESTESKMSAISARSGSWHLTTTA